MTLAERLQRSWWQRRPDGLARLLQPLSWLYGRLAERQRARQQPERIGPVVVVVGNLIVGGAGKTPTVIALVQALRSAGWTPGVISRGYGRRDDMVTAVSADSRAADVGDEPLLIHLRTRVPVVVGRDRVAAARQLCAAHPAVDLLLSDDGLQHHRLARNVEVLVFDERGIGNGLLLPAGPLRQPLPARLPPQSLVLYNAESATTPLPGWNSRRRLTGAVALEAWWRGDAAAPEALSALRGRTVWAAAGMAAPERFFTMLQAQALSLRRLPLPDHHAFDTLPWPADAQDVVVTEKDAVKLDPARCGGSRVWVVTLDLTLPPAFIAALHELLPVRPS